MGKVHLLKTVQPYFDAVSAGYKTFEIRFDDRSFAVGDILRLTEYRPFGQNGSEENTRRYIDVEVTYILYGGYFGLRPGYCVMGIKPIGKEDNGKDGATFPDPSGGSGDKREE